ncbi:hypothetical protein VitviT2T_025892 [Vitis vinifera]|uniref:Uncharacterized protein n=2 Tax=Vitis vinifera TaxID=29760 RepID=A0ABY9DNG2_VITVI|nr:uncharacterized protein LOC100255921 [Vitis vinifera]WKA08145.1 hypothetical protein VitviT2T_025892 [Vitis vinifera]|eukprot:XP_002276499.1 PREDICTED: uncharacterized protein LOC100255921 [Vitis vinifera]
MMDNPAEWANKRVREEDSDPDSVESKRIRVDPDESDGLNSPEAKRIQDDLLDILEDSDAGDPAILGLDSVIRSFEEEILVPPAGLELASVCGDSQPGLGYLWEASDDELGLPPTDGASGEENKIEAADLEANSSGFFGHGGDVFGFDDEIPSYDSFEFGIGGELASHSNTSEFLMLDGLFDYSDQRYEPAEFSEVSWQHESLPAV